MGSGISLGHEQIIHIIQREIDSELRIKLDKKRPVDDYGNPIAETFDEEEYHIKMTRQLHKLLKELNRKNHK